MRQDEVRRQRNASYKTRMKNLVKKAEIAIAKKDKEEAQEAMKNAVPVLDRLATKGIVHPNKVARKKSRLMRKLNALTTGETK